MKNDSVLFHDNYSTTSAEYDNLNSTLMKILRDDSSTRSSSDLSFEKQQKNKKYFTKLKYKSSRCIFPLIYFCSSTFFLFNLLFVNIFEAEETRKYFELMPLSPFPSFYISKQLQPNIFNAIVLIISISGFFNIFCFCSLLTQRFSVPELHSNKLIVHLMFILGILANICFIFYGCAPEILSLEANHIKQLNVSLSMIIFLAYIFFNTLFGTMTMIVLENLRTVIAFNDKRLKRNIRTKKIITSMTVFVMFIYISAILINCHIKSEKELNKNKPHNEEKYTPSQDENKIFLSDSQIQAIHFLLFVLPFFLFAINSVLNLSYYFDISYLENVINIILDKEFFLTTDESTRLLSKFPV
jgi:hypothetical protein